MDTYTYMAKPEELEGSTKENVEVTYLSGRKGSILIGGIRYNKSIRKPPVVKPKRVYKKRDRNEYQKTYRKARLVELKKLRKIVSDNKWQAPTPGTLSANENAPKL